MGHEKPKREIDKDYLKWIRQQPCLVSIGRCGIGCGCEGEITAHHDPTIGAGGSDFNALPFCLAHHIPGVHSMGKKTFQEIYNIDFNRERVRLLKNYIILLKNKGKQ